MGQHRPRPAHEIAKPSVTGSDEAPDQADRDHAEDQVARRFVQGLKLVAGKMGNGKRADERPVPDAHQRVPDLHRRGRGIVCMPRGSARHRLVSAFTGSAG